MILDNQYVRSLLILISLTISTESLPENDPPYCDLSSTSVKVKMSRADICHPHESPYKLRFFTRMNLKQCIEQGGRLPHVLQARCKDPSKTEINELEVSLITADAKQEAKAENEAPFGFSFAPGFAVTHSRHNEQFYLISNTISSTNESRTRMSPLLEAHYLWPTKRSQSIPDNRNDSTSPKRSLVNRHGFFIAGLLEGIELGEEAPTWGIGYMIGINDQLTGQPLNVGFGLLFESDIPELKPEYSLGMTIDENTKIEDVLSNTGSRTSLLIMFSVNF